MVYNNWVKYLRKCLKKKNAIFGQNNLFGPKMAYFEFLTHYRKHLTQLLYTVGISKVFLIREHSKIRRSKGGEGGSQFSRKRSQGGQGFGKFSRAINVQICCSFGKLFSLKILVILAIKLHLLKPFSSLSIYGTIHSLNHTNLGLFRAPFQDLTSPLIRVWFALHLDELAQVMLSKSSLATSPQSAILHYLADPIAPQ